MVHLGTIRVHTAGELSALLKHAVHPVLLQFSSERCPRCVPFEAAIVEQARSFEFEHRLVMVETASELVDKFAVFKLPAFAFVQPESHKDHCMPVTVHQPASVEDVQRAVRATCAPRFDLDADF